MSTARPYRDDENLRIVRVERVKVGAFWYWEITAKGGQCETRVKTSGTLSIEQAISKGRARLVEQVSKV